MKATEKLRQMLDTRGVEWQATESEIDHVTAWIENGGHAEFFESKTINHDLLQISYYDPTPEQAVEATMGRGTCHVESVARNDYGYAPQVSDYTFELSCGHSVTWDERPDYCPWCGREVVE